MTADSTIRSIADRDDVLLDENPEYAKIREKVKIIEKKLHRLEKRYKATDKELSRLRDKSDTLRKRERLKHYLGKRVTPTAGLADPVVSTAKSIVLREVRRTRVLCDIDGKQWSLPMDWIQESGPGQIIII